MKPGHGRMDKILLLAVILISLVAITALYSATFVRGANANGVHPLVAKQCLWIVSGFVLALIISGTDYMRMLNFAYVAYGINLILLIYLLLFGGETFGAKRWINLGFFSLQPSEFVKITVIFVLAAFLGEEKKREEVWVTLLELPR